MLSFNLRIGDDVWLGRDGDSLDAYQQIVLNKVNDQFLTVLTPTEVIDLLLDDRPIDSGIMGAKIAAREDASDRTLFSFGIDAPQDVRIMRGRVYRRQLDG
jgi:hypothetical protein